MQLYPPCWMLLQGVPPLLFAMNLFWFGKIARGALSLLEKSPHARVKVA